MLGRDGSEMLFERAWGKPMPSYRLYCLDGAGRISLAEWIEAEGDEEAVAAARAMEHGARKCEVWNGDRLVAKLEARDLADD
jgi:hypothetical protein